MDDPISVFSDIYENQHDQSKGVEKQITISPVSDTSSVSIVRVSELRKQPITKTLKPQTDSQQISADNYGTGKPIRVTIRGDIRNDQGGK